MIARGITITDAAPIALHEAEDDQPLDARRERAADRAEDKQRQPEIERRLAADHVGDRAVDELRQAEADEEAISVICVAAVVASRSAAIVGSAGRYMSIANGPTAPAGRGRWRSGQSSTSWHVSSMGWAGGGLGPFGRLQYTPRLLHRNMPMENVFAFMIKPEE